MLVDPRKFFEKLEELEKNAIVEHAERVFKDPVDRKFTTISTAARVMAIRDVRDELLTLTKTA